MRDALVGDAPDNVVGYILGVRPLCSRHRWGVFSHRNLLGGPQCLRSLDCTLDGNFVDKMIAAVATLVCDAALARRGG
jgi:hypothetical protein